MYLYINTYVCAHVCATIWLPGANGGQRRALEPLELELQAVLRHAVWEVNPGPLQKQQCLNH